MGATQSIPNSIDVDEIQNQTGLSKKQIQSLWSRFFELDRDARGDAKGYKGYLDADDFGRVPKFDENPIAHRLIKIIFDDFGKNGRLSFPQFVEFMGTFGQRDHGGHEHHHHRRRRSSGPMPLTNHPPTTPKEDLESVKYSPEDTAKARKIKFMFRMYDIDRDGHLSLEDIQEILKMMVGKISDDEASIIAEKVIGEFTDEQPNVNVNLEVFQRTLQTLDFNDKMGLKLLK